MESSKKRSLFMVDSLFLTRRSGQYPISVVDAAKINFSPTKKYF
jgi:hypothetical protein